MTVSTIASIAAGLTRTTGNSSTRATALFNSLLTPTTNQNSGDTSGLTQALTLQNQVAQFRVASQNAAQASTALDAADSGVTDILGDLDQLSTLVQKASSTTDTTERAALKTQFDAVLQKIDQKANSTKFNNESLLNGSSAQLRVASENKDIKGLAIESLQTDRLFKTGLPSIIPPESVQTALDKIKDAKAYAAKQRDTIAALQKGLDLASSSLQTAIQNNEASRSSLNDFDLVSTLLGGGTAPSTNDLASQLAQTTKLPGNILSLLKE